MLVLTNPDNDTKVEDETFFGLVTKLRESATAHPCDNNQAYMVQCADRASDFKNGNGISTEDEETFIRSLVAADFLILTEV